MSLGHIAWSADTLLVRAQHASKRTNRPGCRLGTFMGTGSATTDVLTPISSTCGRARARCSRAVAELGGGSVPPPGLTLQRSPPSPGFKFKTPHRSMPDLRQERWPGRRATSKPTRQLWAAGRCGQTPRHLEGRRTVQTGGPYARCAWIPNYSPPLPSPGFKFKTPG
jgi:hypothetical protein